MSSDMHISVILTAAMFCVSSCGISHSIRNISVMGIAVEAATDTVHSNEIFMRASASDTAMHHSLSFGESPSGAEILQGAYVYARHKTIPERAGAVNAEFSVNVPSGMSSPKWQLCVTPVFIIGGQKHRADSLLFTGEEFAKAQLEGYRRYDKYLKGLEWLSDEQRMVYRRNLEIFLERYSANPYGLTKEEIAEHYTRKIIASLYNIRLSRKDAIRKRQLHSPFISSGIRIDTTVSHKGQSFTCPYEIEILTRPRIKKIGLVLESFIRHQGNELYRASGKDTVYFYISSLSSLADTSLRYIRHISKRDSVFRISSHFEFTVNKATLDTSCGRNRQRLEHIIRTIDTLGSSPNVILDSITVNGYCSPEGKWEYNLRLSALRAKTINDTICKIIFRNNTNRGGNTVLYHPFGTTSSNATDTLSDSESPAISLITSRHYGKGEDWASLEKALLDAAEYKGQRNALKAILCEAEPEIRESKLSSYVPSEHLEQTYEQLRRVEIVFHMHARDAISDTTVTETVDERYMQGVKYLTDRDYPKAISILKDYDGYNTALAYILMDYNHTAIRILSETAATAAGHYLLAIAYARTGNIPMARECLDKAVAMNPALAYRARLDPEISQLQR